MSIQQRKYLVLFLGLVWLGGFAVWAWARMPELAIIAACLLVVNAGGCAAVLGLFRASRKRAGGVNPPPPL